MITTENGLKKLEASDYTTAALSNADSAFNRLVDAVERIIALCGADDGMAAIEALGGIADALAAKLSLSGGSMTGHITFGNNKRVNGLNTDGAVISLVFVDANNNQCIGSVAPGTENMYLSVPPGKTICKRTSSTDSAEMLDADNLSSYVTAAYVNALGIDLSKLKGGATYGVAAKSAVFVPVTYATNEYLDNTLALGYSGARWKDIYAASGTINTSDARDKRDVADIDAARALVMAMHPRSFKFNGGQRTHFGFIAQEFEQAMQAAGIDDCAALIKGPLAEDAVYSPDMSEEEYRYGLRYDELIAPLLAVVQQQEERIAALEAKAETGGDGNV